MVVQKFVEYPDGTHGILLYDTDSQVYIDKPPPAGSRVSEYNPVNVKQRYLRWRDLTDEAQRMSSDWVDSEGIFHMVCGVDAGGQLCDVEDGLCGGTWSCSVEDIEATI